MHDCCKKCAKLITPKIACQSPKARFMLISQGEYMEIRGKTRACSQCFSWGLKKQPKTLNNSEFTGFASTWEISGEQRDK